MTSEKNKWLLLLPYMLVGLLPIGVFVFEGIYRSLVSGDWYEYINYDLRSVVLLLKTLFYSLAVSLLAIIVGTGLGIAIYSCKKKWRRRSIGLLLLLLPLPVMVHTLVWMDIIGQINMWLNHTLRATGWGISTIVQTTAMIPMAGLIIYDGIRKIPKESIESGVFLSKDSKVFWRVWLPQCRNSMKTAGMIVFLLTFNDYSVPSTFAVNTYAMEIFAKYSVSMDSSDALAVSLPVVVIGLLLTVLLVQQLDQQFLHNVRNNESIFLERMKVISRVVKPFFIALIVTITVIPILILVSGIDYKNFDMALIGGVDILATIGVCFGAAAVAVPIMIVTALSIYNEGVWNRWRLLVIFVPALISPSLVGASLIGFFNSQIFRMIYTSPLMVVLAVVTRFMPIGVLIIAVGLKKIEAAQIQTAMMLPRHQIKVMTKVLLPQIWPSILMAASVIVLFGIGELGASVMVMPPGMSTITVRMFGYLHYGATEKLMEISMLTIAIIGCIEMLVYRSGVTYARD